MQPSRSLPFVAALCLAAALPAQNCANTSIGAVPLDQLGTATYQGHAGGLYGNGLNVPPPAHQALGDAHLALVVPRDGAGAPAANGRIVLLSIGMSNTTQEFTTWLATANTDPDRNPAVTIVDGAQGGQDAVIVANPAANFWNVVDQRLANAGVTTQQVQVVWIKEAIIGVSGGFPAAAQQLQGLLGQIVRNVKQRYPNTQLCFLSSRTYAGYATIALNPEPYAYESAFAVQWLLGQQMAGDAQLNCDAAAGPVVAPWLGFGPYLWTDGMIPRSDGLIWTCSDVQPDGTHPSPAGRAKVAALLQQFFHGNDLTAPWYVLPGNAALFQVHGAGCMGSVGVPAMRSNGLPTLGNGNFRIGVEQARPSALALLCWSTAPANLPLAGACSLLIDPTPALPVWPSIISPSGTRAELLVIPNQPTLIGAELFAQWLIDDPAGAPLPGLLGIAASAGCRLRVGL